MRRPPVPEDARAALDVWTTPDALVHDLFIAPGEDPQVLTSLLVEGVGDALAGRRPYRLDEPTWLAQFVVRGTQVGCGYGALGADGPLLRHTLRQLTACAALALEGDQAQTRVEERLAVVEGRLRALERWDVLSMVVAAAHDRTDALRRLAGEPFRFTELQADDVLDLPVVARLQDNRASLTAEREHLRTALAALADAAAPKAGRVTSRSATSPGPRARSTLVEVVGRTQSGEGAGVADSDARLGRERADIEGQIAALTRSFDDVVESIEDVGNDDEHDPDGATIAFERAQVLALLGQARRNLVEVDAALERLATGAYGTCERCGRPIPSERLEALPTARTCVDCAP